MNRGSILVADDDAAIRTIINQALTRAGHNVRVTSNAATLYKWITEGQGSVVVSDVVMPDGDGIELLEKIQNVRPELPVIVMSAQNTFMTAVRASEAGAFDYLPKPFDLDHLVNLVSQALDRPHDNRTALQFEQYHKDMPLVGRSPAMQDIYRSIAQAMHTDVPVLISGEAGTGKRLTAEVIHRFGDRSMRPFVPVDLSLLRRDRVAEELFGAASDRGSVMRTAGKVGEANGGTIFLENVDLLPDEAQAWLLGMLDEKRMFASRSDHAAASDFRVICSTCADLEKLAREGTLRPDLIYRLNVFPLRLPPLRSRMEDIPDLVRHFAKLHELEGGTAKLIDADAITAFKEHDWPGNVLELSLMVTRICLINPQERISRRMVEAELAQATAGEHQRINNNTPGGFSSFQDAAAYFADRELADKSNVEPVEGLYHHMLAEFERPLIIAALRASNGNQLKASGILGLNRNTLRKKIKEHEIRITKSTG